MHGAITMDRFDVFMRLSFSSIVIYLKNLRISDKTKFDKLSS